MNEYLTSSCSNWQDLILICSQRFIGAVNGVLVFGIISSFAALVVRFWCQQPWNFLNLLFHFTLISRLAWSAEELIFKVNYFCFCNWLTVLIGLLHLICGVWNNVSHIDIGNLKYFVGYLFMLRLVNFSILGSCKWRHTLGCSFESQLPSGSYEYTHYCTVICLPGNITY